MERRRVLRETIAAFETCAPPDRFHRLAHANLARWSAAADASDRGLRLDVVPGDWGDVTREVTRQYGVCFAVLNMANAYVPGGAYVEGAIAQEENMFRRTDCHFHIREDELDETGEYYRADMTSLLTARAGRVYLDTDNPRVCIRGSEDRAAPDLGYPWLPDDEVFPFYELRASAKDLRGGGQFDEGDARRRIAAQLDTMRSHGIRHAVLSAFGCGAFRNPAPAVARIYRDEIAVRERDFSVLVFAIFAAGYGPDNYMPFRAVFRDDA
jgi:hypothetical protein